MARRCVRPHLFSEMCRASLVAVRRSDVAPVSFSTSCLFRVPSSSSARAFWRGRSCQGLLSSSRLHRARPPREMARFVPSTGFGWPHDGLLRARLAADPPRRVQDSPVQGFLPARSHSPFREKLPPCRWPIVADRDRSPRGWASASRSCSTRRSVATEVARSLLRALSSSRCSLHSR